jgi:hypothetical protein
MKPEGWTTIEQDPARANTGSRSALAPEWVIQFLDILRHTGNVSLSARQIGWSRSTIYAFAARSPSFRDAMKEALTEGRELLLGEGWRRATQWNELRDPNDPNKVLQRTPPSDRLLAILIQGYFQEFKPGSQEDKAVDNLLPDSADLTQLSDEELQDLDRILEKAGADELRPRQD